MSFSNENDPFQRIIDVSWQETGTRYAPTEESYNNDWPEDQNGHVLQRPTSVLHRRLRQNRCIPPPPIMRGILQEMSQDSTYLADVNKINQKPYIQFGLSPGSLKKEDEFTPTDGFYDFTDYRTKPTE